MINKYVHKDHHHVNDREVDILYQLIRTHNGNYLIEEIIIPYKKKIFDSWFSKKQEDSVSYSIYLYKDGYYSPVQENLDKYHMQYFLKGILHTR
jgi:hypothetical protein